MKKMKSMTAWFYLGLFFLVGCAGLMKPDMAVDRTSRDPGSKVTFKGKWHELLGMPISVGDPLPPFKLVDSMTMQEIDLSQTKGSVLFLSVVPSVDTKVCEAQTHYLGEEGDVLPESVRRITISRDLPFAHQRFAEEAGLTDIQFLSDYKDSNFGLSTGLLVDDLMLLARSVVLVDQRGVVRYIQVVPEMTHLPDMEKAFEEATQLAREGQAT